MSDSRLQDSTESLECVNCILCGNEHAGLRCIKEGYRLVRCSSCGLVYVNPRPRPETSVEMYNMNHISPFDYYVEHRAEDSRTFAKRLILVEQCVQPGRLLDVGCAVGTMLEVAQSRGWQAQGIDINRRSVEYSKKERGLNAEVGTISDVNASGCFDAVVMNDVLEHLHDPMAAMRRVHSLLAEGGIVFIATPDIGSPLARITGRRWLHLKPDEHIYYFSRRTITKLLEQAGFSSVVRIKSLGRFRNAATAVRKAATYSTLPYAVLKALGLVKALRRLRVWFNCGDEMGVIARK